MEDLKQRILDIIHKPQLASLATVTAQNNPWVRYVVTVGSADLSLRCATFGNSRKAQQITTNPDVHLTLGVTSFMEMQPYLQIQAQAQISTEHGDRHGFWNELLEPIFDGPDDPNYSIVIINPYRIEYCTPGSYEPEVWVK